MLRIIYVVVLCPVSVFWHCLVIRDVCETEDSALY